MTVLENVKSAEQAHDPDPLLTTLLAWPALLKQRRLDDQSLEQLALFNLDSQASRLASELSYGDQRRLEIVRALALRPRLLLLTGHGEMNTREYERTAARSHIRDQYGLTSHSGAQYADRDAVATGSGVR
jgi:branched-chain amino acid transport system ATP-binding protein